VLQGIWEVFFLPQSLQWGINLITTIIINFIIERPADRASLGVRC
jgi:hypothetical protein